MNTEDNLDETRRRWAVVVWIVGGCLILVTAAAGWLLVPMLEAKPEPTFVNPVVPPTTATARPTVTATSATPTPTPSPKPEPSEKPRAKSFEIANVSENVARYDKPDGKRIGTVANNWYGWPSKLPVIDKEDGWLQVRLQQRPNEDTAWIKAKGIEITSTPYLIEIDVEKYRLTLFKAGKKIFTAPVGVGKKATPTPKGHFFVTMQEPPSSAGYGPVTLTLSAHSETIKNYKGSGDAIGAIHGPVGSDAKIGENGAAISNGCVRMHKADLIKLKDVIPGSPVEIF